VQRTLFDKLWEAHVVKSVDGMDVIYIDKHFIHEVTSPQAFTGIEQRGIPLANAGKTIATPDHNVPTKDQHLPIVDPLSKHQVETLRGNCEKHEVEIFDLGHDQHGIVHIIGPENGITKPGMSIVCGDSHTSTHGAFGCLAFGIGTSQVEQVFASQCLLMNRPKTMRINIDGVLAAGVSSKDVILHIISKLTAAGGTGYFIEYTGSTIAAMSMEARMTVCNMSIEMGARGGMIAPDDKTYAYLKGKQYAPSGESWDDAMKYWTTLKTDEKAVFDRTENFLAVDIMPMVTYGTNPGMGISIANSLPTDIADANFSKSLQYMDFQKGEKLEGKKIQHVFIGSCTNGRIEDLRKVASFVNGKQKAAHVNAMIVPGSKKVELAAKSEGLDKIFEAAGFELREPGCSACLGMNEDKVPASEYCVSTSNRNFEGRQGQGARTILASPLMAAAAAIQGEIVDVRKYI